MIIDSDIVGIVEFHLYILVSSVYIRVRSTLTKISNIYSCLTKHDSECPATRNEVNEVKGILQSKKVWGKFGHFYAKPIEVFPFKPIKVIHIKPI